MRPEPAASPPAIASHRWRSCDCSERVGWGTSGWLATSPWEYFAEGERGITKDASCTYLAPWTTDAAAWVIGAALLMRGLQTGDPLVTFAGAAVATLHVAQFAAHKVITRPEVA